MGTFVKLAFPFLLACLAEVSLHAQVVRFTTSLGNIDVQLLPDAAPRTVANFLNYVNKGAYTNTFFHRSVANFVIQAGGFRWQSTGFVEIPSDPPVRNEYNLSNLRGTIAMAKLGSGPDTATNQWFFNLSDNSANLNNQNGGFTVFGRVADAAGLAVMDEIAKLRIYDLGSPFDAIPLASYTSGNVQEQNLALVKSISLLSGVPAISENGVLTASGFGGFAFAAPGSFIEIYGLNLIGADATPRGWAGSDFNGSSAPTSLDGVAVTIGGRAAYVNYVSQTQINVQVPGNVPSGSSLPVIVNSRGLITAPVTLQIRARAPGLLAPAGFKVGDRQYVVAVRPDGTFVSNGTIPNLPAAPAVQGETLILYGTGFGSVQGAPIAGQIASGLARIVETVEIKVGGEPAEVAYAGLAPGLVGVYQFNFRVPNNAPGGDQPIELSTGGEPLAGQRLFLPVKQP